LRGGDRAQSQAREIADRAVGQFDRLVQGARGEADRFTEVLTESRKTSPRLRRLSLEALSELLPRSSGHSSERKNLRVKPSFRVGNRHSEPALELHLRVKPPFRVGTGIPSRLWNSKGLNKIWNGRGVAAC